MAWQAFLASITEVETTHGFEVVYTDGKQKLLKRYNAPKSVSDDDINNAVRSELAAFAVVDAKPPALTYIVGDEIVPV